MCAAKTTLNPFPGLRPFMEDEEHLFFGREKPVTELLSRLRVSHFLTLIGTSGCGKSSLIRAGLFPSLYRGFMARAGSSWRTALFRPGDNPIGNLVDALNRADIFNEDPISRSFIETTLRRSNRGLIEIIKQARMPEYDNLLIVVDQFEELFRYSRVEKIQTDRKRDSADFVDLLLECFGQPEVPVYIILAMRSDFIGDCTEFRGLPEALNDSQYLIPRMTREELKSAAAGPIAVGGAKISHPLLSRLLNDVGDNPDQLPILQHALMRTWDYWAGGRDNGEELNLRHYHAVGGMERALSEHAEEALKELKTEKEQLICEKTFKLLTDKGQTGRGVRRPAKVGEICRITGASEKEVIKVINLFRRPGRTFLMPPIEEKLNTDSVIDISHESLMRIWERLMLWVKQEAKSAECYQHLAKTAALHEENKAALFRDPELMLALKWQEENKPNAEWAKRYDPSFDRAVEFLKASKKQQEQEAAEKEKLKDLEIKEKERVKKIRTIRFFSIIISIAALVSIAFGVWALNSKREADQQRRIAELERHEADKLREIAQIQQKIAEGNEQKANRQKTIADMEKNKAIASQEEADRNAEEAEKAKEKSEEAEQEAKRSAFEAQIKGSIVAMKKEEARFAQTLAKAKELAVISIAQTGNEELKALLALTSYKLNLEAYDKLDRETDEIFGEFKQTIPDEMRERVKFEELAVEYDRLQGVSKNDSALPEVFVSLRDAYILREDSEDKIYPSESWALAAASNNELVFNGRDGKLLMAPLKPGQVGSGKLPGINENAVTILMGNGSNILRVTSFAGLGRRLFSGTKQGHIIDWGNSFMEDGKMLGKHTGPILSLTYSKTKDCLIYSFQNLIYLHDFKDNGRVFDEFEDGNFIRALTVVESPEGSFLIAADSKGHIFYYNLLEGMKRNKLNDGIKSKQFYAIAYNKSKSMLVLGDSDGKLHCYSNINPDNLKANSIRESTPFYRNHEGIVRTLAFSSDNRYLASGSLDGTIMLWDLKRSIGKEKEINSTVDIAAQEPILTIINKFKILSLAFITREIEAGNEIKEETYMIFCDGHFLRICPTKPEVFNEELSKIEKREIDKKKAEEKKMLRRRLQQYIDDIEEQMEIVKSFFGEMGLEWEEK